jgi:predicted kinase
VHGKTVASDGGLGVFLDKIWCMATLNTLLRSGSVLIVFGGLPGAGKTTLARDLAARMGAVYLRIDTIEQAIRNSPGVSQAINEEGYRVAYAVAEDNLRLGRTVISDSVNPVRESRDAWMEVGGLTNSFFLEVEVVCSDAAAHRQRVESRRATMPGLPAWEDVLAREYDPWNRDHIVIDTAHKAVADCATELQTAIMSRMDDAKANVTAPS